MKSKKSARYRAPKSRANMETGKLGRTEGSTQLVTLTLRAQAIKLFLSGVSAVEIAERMGKSRESVYGYISETRVELLRANKERFMQRLALQLDDAMDTIAINAQLLSDTEWLKTAAPERIDAISRVYGILSDKCFVLLAAGRNSGAVTTGTASAEAVSG